jgi:hypothetical protein
MVEILPAGCENKLKENFTCTCLIIPDMETLSQQWEFLDHETILLTILTYDTCFSRSFRESSGLS